MKIELKELTAETVLGVANALAAAAHTSDIIEIVLPPGKYCPNRIVPLMALVDAYSRKGLQVSVRDMAISSPDLLPDVAVDPMGRVWRFAEYRDQYKIVESFELALTRIPALGAGFRTSFSWCLNEVMDNVLNHSAASNGSATGYVMVQYAPDENRLKVCVFDLGIGLLRSFAVSPKYHPQTSPEAIAMAVKANVTSGNGQGNGLWGLHELVRQSSDGRLLIKSGDGEYLYAPKQGTESSRACSAIPGFDGTTLVDFQFVSHDRLSIDEVFPSSCGVVDNWLEHNEIDNDTVLLKVREVTAGTGSRASGRELRTMIENVIDQDHHKVVLDFEGISSCSSSFVDELIAKLVQKYGFIAFSQLITVMHASGVSERLINHSLSQRIAQEVNGVESDVGSSGNTRPADADYDSSSSGALKPVNDDYIQPAFAEGVAR